MRVLNLYVPNGKAVGDEKYHYKLRWLDAVTAYIDNLRRTHEKTIIIGDFNITPADLDVHDPDAWRDKILCSAPERQALADILALGYRDAYRNLHPTPCNTAGGTTAWAACAATSACAST